MGNVLGGTRFPRTSTILVGGSTLLGTSACIVGTWAWGWIGFAVALMATWGLVTLAILALYRARRREEITSTASPHLPPTVVWPPRQPADLT